MILYMHNIIKIYEGGVYYIIIIVIEIQLIFSYIRMSCTAYRTDAIEQEQHVCAL